MTLLWRANGHWFSLFLRVNYGHRTYVCLLEILMNPLACEAGRTANPDMAKWTR